MVTAAQDGQNSAPENLNNTVIAFETVNQPISMSSRSLVSGMSELLFD